MVRSLHQHPIFDHMDPKDTCFNHNVSQKFTLRFHNLYRYIERLLLKNQKFLPQRAIGVTTINPITLPE